MVQKATGADFKFFIYKTDLSVDTTSSRACGSTATHTKIGLFGSILITSDSTDLYACLYDSTGTGPITILKLLISAGKQIYYADGNKIHAIYNDGTNSKVCTYTVTGSLDLSCADIAGTIAAAALSTASGN